MFEDILGQTVDHNWCPFQPGLDKGRSKFGTCRGGHDISRDLWDFLSRDSRLFQNGNQMSNVKNSSCRTYPPKTNMTMENPPFEDVLPFGKGGFPLLLLMEEILHRRGHI